MIILVCGFLLVFVRLAVLMATAPVLGNQSIPAHIRQLLALTVALAIAPAIITSQVGRLPLAVYASSTAGNVDADARFEISHLFSAMLSEALLGGLIGLGILVVFSAASMMGAAVGQLSGIQFADSGDASGSLGQQPTDRLIALTTMAAFVLIGGPELILTTVIESFDAVPIGSTLARNDIVNLLMTLFQQSFELTVRAIAPAIATLLVTTTLIGMLSRTIPHLNLLHVGISTNLGVMLLAILLTLSGCVWWVLDDLQRASQLILDSLHTFEKQAIP